ncbi:MAG: hypothetical protein LBQ54_06060 [Planctomycetaceae bacterium]|jgi:hypothetical protein|nr:hypothetical protein [Planctomycetaceae bacterium]
MKQMIAWSLCLLVLVGISGCEKSRRLKTEYVEGVVTLDGLPISNVTLTFIPSGTAGESANGYSDEKGGYKLSSINGDAEKGALEGEYKITLTKVEVTEYKEGDPKAPKDSQGRPYYVTQKELIPKVYTNASTTPLTYTVVKGKQTHNIELLSKP